MSEKVRLASVGLGWWGNVLADGAVARGAEIAACFARTPESREEFARKQGCEAAPSYEAVLDDPAIDGVILAIPHSTHADYVVTAAAAGKHVFVEKPFTLTVADAKRAIAAMEEAGKVLLVGHNRRRQPAIRRLKELVAGGDLGLVVAIETNQSVPNAHKFAPGYWRADRAESPLGSMTSLGVHMIDTMHYLLGPVGRVFAFTNVLIEQPPIDDVTTVVFEFESGALGYLGTSFVVPRTATVAVRGTDAAAMVAEDGARFYLQNREDPAPVEEPIEKLDTVADELGEFVRCIREGGTPETGGTEALEVIAVMEAMVAASESGTAQAVADFR
jgi:predicted dehydrogenase